MDDDPEVVKASRWEVVGAWLGIWTPPIGARIPPVPWMRIGLAVLLLAAAGAVLAVVFSGDRRSNAARDARATAQAQSDRRTAALRRQRLVRSRVTDPAAPLPEVRAAVFAEARSRHTAGDLLQPPRAVDCATVGRPARSRGRLVVDCDVLTSVIRDGGGSAVGRLSIPFRAVVERPSGRLSICALSPPAGEQALPDPRSVVALPRACRR